LAQAYFDVFVLWTVKVTTTDLIARFVRLFASAAGAATSSAMSAMEATTRFIDRDSIRAAPRSRRSRGLRLSFEAIVYVMNGTIRSATMFATLIIGLIAGPAVSL